MIKMLNGKIAVTKINKHKSSAMFSVVESPDVIGLISYADEGLIKDSKVAIGMKICFGPKRERVTIGGKELEIMDFDNILAIIEDQEDESEKISEETDKAVS